MMTMDEGQVQVRCGVFERNVKKLSGEGKFKEEMRS